jgi:hypothetical protein
LQRVRHPWLRRARGLLDLSTATFRSEANVSKLPDRTAVLLGNASIKTFLANLEVVENELIPAARLRELDRRAPRR